MQHQRPRSVLVTGASQGIGAAIACDLQARGFQVFAGVRREVDGQRLAAAAPGLVPLLLDVTNADQLVQAVRTVEAIVGAGGLRGLVNNAGTVVVGPLEYLPLNILRQQFEVNVFGPFAVTQAFLPLLRRGTGRILNIGSANVYLPLPFFGPYSASKHALAALTNALRLELAAWNIPVILIEPGNVATRILPTTLASAHQLRTSLPPQAHERYGAAIDIVEAAARQASANAAPVDGVVRTVHAVLVAQRPKGRYVLGADANAATILARYVPQRIRDWFVRRVLGLKNARVDRGAPGPAIR